jgi:hypothetical protein
MHVGRPIAVRLLGASLALGAGACGRFGFAGDDADGDGDAAAIDAALIDAAPPADAPPVPSGWASDPDFVGLTHLTQLSSTTSEFDPFLAADHRTLYFSSVRDGNGEIYVATRPTVDGAFGTPTALGADVNTGAAETTFVHTPDGLTAYMVSNRDGNYDVYRATRADPGNPWGPFAAVSELNSGMSEYNIALAGDQRSLWFCSERPGGVGGQDLWVSTRAGLGDPWGAPSPAPFNTGENDGGPSLSADGRVVVWASGGDLYFAYRDDPTAAFGAPHALVEFNTPVVETTPFLRDDGRELLFTREAGDGQGAGDWDLWIVQLAE